MQKRKMQKIQENARSRKKDWRKEEEIGQAFPPSMAINHAEDRLLAEELEKLLRAGQKPLRLDQILRIAAVPRREKKHVEALLHALAQEGRLVRVHGGQWMVSDGVRHFVGRYSVQRSGVGFVDMAQAEHASSQKTSAPISIFIHPSQAGEAWHGDRVRVAMLPQRRGHGATRKIREEKPKQAQQAAGHAEGRIVEVLERQAKEIVVRVDMTLAQQSYGTGQKKSTHTKRNKKSTKASSVTTDFLLCAPCDARFPLVLRVKKTQIRAVQQDNAQEYDMQSMEHNALLLVRPTQRITGHLWEADFISCHGREDDVAVQEALVKINHQCPSDFPLAALEEAAALPPCPVQEDYVGREDLRTLPFVTIDGETARDFDDAIYVQPLEQGGWALQVAIADVTHYVPIHSALDKEAKIRGNSWYFPRSVEPMFPASLSNGLCSLNPQVDRLVMVAHMHFDAQGQRHKSAFYAAVIHSHARLTYTQVKSLILDNDQASQDTFIQNPHGQTVLNMLGHANSLAHALQNMREQRGSLDFHRPEPEYHFDAQGRIVNITRKEEHFAHKLIEECMIAANEAVAEFLEKKEIPFLYRIHPEPDSTRLEGLFRTLASTALAKNVPKNPKAKDLQGILHAAEGNEQEFLVGRLALRTMPQARYQPENVGHFGLASTCYCHFTSPIRRYADMVVHRALKYALQRQKKAKYGDVSPAIPCDDAAANTWSSIPSANTSLGAETPLTAPLQGMKLVALGDGLNATERASMEAEREMARRLAVLMLNGRQGQEYDAIIAGVSDFGIFVELDVMPVEGMVPVKDLGDDYFEFDVERQELIGVMSGERFVLGQKLRVRLVDVNLGRLEITFALCHSANPAKHRLPRKQAAKLHKGRKPAFSNKRHKRR